MGIPQYLAIGAIRFLRRIWIVSYRPSNSVQEYYNLKNKSPAFSQTTELVWRGFYICFFNIKHPAADDYTVRLLTITPNMRTTGRQQVITRFKDDYVISSF